MSTPTPKPRRPNRWRQTRAQAKRKLKISLIMGLIAALSFSLGLYLQNKGIEHPIISPICRILFGVGVIGFWWLCLLRGLFPLYYNIPLFKESFRLKIEQSKTKFERKTNLYWEKFTEIIDD